MHTHILKRMAFDNREAIELARMRFARGALLMR